MIPSAPLPAPFRDLNQTPWGRWFRAVMQFLQAEFPRGSYPQGPSNVTVIAKSDAILVSWTAENTGAVIKGYNVWRADAGTMSIPTTPQFTAAVRLGTVYGEKLPNSPIGSVFEWFDLGFLAADRTDADRKQFRYWVTSFDNQATAEGPFRESPPVPAGYATVPIAASPPSAVALAPSANLSIAGQTAVIASQYYDILDGFSVDIASGGILEIT